MTPPTQFAFVVLATLAARQARAEIPCREPSGWERSDDAPGFEGDVGVVASRDRGTTDLGVLLRFGPRITFLREAGDVWWGNQRGVDLQIGISDRAPFTIGISPVLRVATRGPLRLPSIIGALVPSVAVAFDADGFQDLRATWSPLPIAVIVTGDVAFELDTVRVAVMASGRGAELSIGTMISITSVPGVGQPCRSHL